MNNNSKQLYLDFEEYIRQGEPSKKEKASIWQTAIGLQAVDGLQTSEYLKTTACRHIEGEIDIDEARKLIKSYYQSKTLFQPTSQRFCLQKHWTSAQMGLSPYTDVYLRMCLNTQESCAITTLQNENGCLTAIR